MEPNVLHAKTCSGWAGEDCRNVEIFFLLLLRYNRLRWQPSQVLAVKIEKTRGLNITDLLWYLRSISRNMLFWWPPILLRASQSNRPRSLSLTPLIVKTDLPWRPRTSKRPPWLCGHRHTLKTDGTITRFASIRASLEIPCKRWPFRLWGVSWSGTWQHSESVIGQYNVPYYSSHNLVSTYTKKLVAISG